MTLSAHAVSMLSSRLPLPFPLWMGLATLLSFDCCIINHNHTHLPIFRETRIGRGLNLILGCLLTLAKGHTSATVVIPHSHNHHLHAGGEQDWARPALANPYRGWRRIPVYLWRARRSMNTGRKLPGAPQPDASLRLRLKTERLVLLAGALTMAIVSPSRFLVRVALPWGLSMAMLVIINLLQHDGCEAESLWNHSRNFVNGPGNWFFFNNGFHTIHHRKPRLHWSLLPAAHAREIVPRIDPSLDEASIFAFISRRYFQPHCLAELPMHERQEPFERELPLAK